MRIACGFDHGGLSLRETILEAVRAAGREVVQQSQPAETATSALSRATLELQIETAIYVLTPSSAQKKKVEEAKAESERQLALLQDLTLNDAPTREAVSIGLRSSNPTG